MADQIKLQVPDLGDFSDVEVIEILVAPGDSVEVRTPGGGGFGPAGERPAALVARDVARGYYTARQASELFGVDVEGAADTALESPREG